LATITKGFWVGQTPVTQAAYLKVVGSNPSHFKGNQLPVESVSWEDAHAYCQRVDMRLPTEAEYEYAARGGSPNARFGPADSVSWYSANSGGSTHEVAQKQANAYGLYDMLGNVDEWVADWYGPYSGASAVDPIGPSTATPICVMANLGCHQDRVIRGGSWRIGAFFARASARGGAGPDFRGDSTHGFRCAGN
jgi:formylglycine-generating enzyme required for sulfatase activity